MQGNAFLKTKVPTNGRERPIFLIFLYGALSRQKQDQNYKATIQAAVRDFH